MSKFLEAGRELDTQKRDEIDLTGEADAPVKDQKREGILAARLYRQLTTYLGQTFDLVMAGGGISVDKGQSLVRGIVDCPVSRDQWFGMINELRYPSQSKSYLVFHHANVAVYCICLAKAIGMRDEEQVELGLLGLFHDIGKLKVADEILFKEGQLSEQEWQALKQSPYESSRIILSAGARYTSLAECALQVYERLDGSGYPRGLKGESVHLHAQLAGLVDVYESMTSNRAYREKWLHYDAIREILKTKKAAFSQGNIKALLRTFAIFPLNSYVKLNSGVIGRVVGVNEELPMRPKVEVLFDAENVGLPVPITIDLVTQSFLYITGSVPETQLPQTDSKIQIII
jgi:HD-GYP domain-containing protein (c-di-GMP phosphodiesterase class II)